MKAVAHTHARPITHEEALVDVDLPEPAAHHHDILVEVKAVSVNPVDVKLRRTADPVGEPRVLGFDAAGIVRAIGPEVAHFGIGDEVWYAGVINRPGSNAEFQAVDERIVGRKPKTLSFADAAAMPLTTITAWEMLFERMMIPRDLSYRGSILILGGAGGVGSMAIQLARHLTSLHVIASASREESRAWCTRMGAHVVIDHSADIAAELAAAGTPTVDFVFSTNNTRANWKATVDVVRPQGRIGLIEPGEGLDARELMAKSVSLHWESMFTRPLLHTPDMIEQHHLLEVASMLVDRGTLVSTRTEHGGTITAVDMRAAHARVESGHMVGKIVLEGF
ncbi:MAG: zinc-binding alcohol dehydrogenase family protein [Acetobacteraceae bacterium]